MFLRLTIKYDPYSAWRRIPADLRILTLEEGGPSGGLQPVVPFDRIKIHIDYLLIESDYTDSAPAGAESVSTTLGVWGCSLWAGSQFSLEARMWRNLYEKRNCTGGQGDCPGVRSLADMASNDAPEETKISDRGMVTIPASLRHRLDIEAGDKLRWNADDDGNISVEVVKQRYGAFDDFEPVSMGGGGSETHDLAGHEDDPAFPERN